MRDSEVVASIVAGDPLGLAAAYDRYADPLFQYCRTLLGDAADAADAVQDTFVIAAARLDGLRDPSQLSPWLYAVARNEALRIPRPENGAPALDEEATVLGAPEGLREHTITLATGQGVVAVAHRAAVLGRAGAFTRSGFPRAASARGALRSSPRRAATVTAAIVIAVIIAVAAFALTGNSGTARSIGSAAPAATTTSAAAPTSATTSARPAATTAAPTPTASPTPTPTPTPAPASAAAPTSAAQPPASTAPPPASVPGALAVYPAGGPLVLSANGQPGRQIDLSGSGAGDWHVTWSLAVANDPDGVISVSASAGTLTSADPTATVTVTANHFVPCGPQSPTITVTPGGAVFSVCTGGFRNFGG